MLPLLAAYAGAATLKSLAGGHGLSGVPLIGGLFNDPAQDDFENKLKENALAWEARRPVIQQQAQNMMGQVNQAYAPVRGALAQMYNGHEVAPPSPAPAPAGPNVPDVGPLLMGSNPPPGPPTPAGYGSRGALANPTTAPYQGQGLPPSYNGRGGLPGFGGR